VQVVQVLAVDEQVQHVVALPADLRARHGTVKGISGTWNCTQCSA